MTLITILQAVLFTAYVLYIKKTYGKLTSISASTYSFKGQDKYWFFGWLVSLAVLNLFQDLGVWGFLTSAALIFTGITTDHAGTFKAANKLHSIAAVSAIALGALGMFFLYGMLFPMVVIALSILTLYNNKHFIWDIEVIAYGTILFSYLLR